MYIQVTNASKEIKGTAILQNINLDLHGGMVYGLQGPNGSGKTMLMRLIAGLIRPTLGSVVVDGKRLGNDIDFPPSMGLLIENPAFLPNYTGFKNLELIADIQRRIGKKEIAQSLSDVGLDPEDKRKYRKYSLGMKQRLGIAAAIMEKPDLILLDEPTNSLDESGTEQICRLIQAECNRGALIILASHDSNLLESIADEIYTIHEGALQGSKRSITAHFPSKSMSQ